MNALSVAATGMLAQQRNVEVVSNNLANMNTTAYMRRRPEFQDLLYQNLRRVGSTSAETGTVVPTGVQIGLGVKLAAVYRIHEQGNLSATDNPFDLAIQGRGYFQVEMPDGTTAYTRDGAFQKDANGQIVTSSGYPLQPAITIPANALSVTIGKDGVVSVTLPNQAAAAQIGNIQLASFVNPGGLQSVGENLFLETAASGTPNPNTPGTNGVGVLNQTYVETSNVNVAEELVLMIQTQRAYELNSRAISTSDNMLGKLTSL